MRSRIASNHCLTPTDGVGSTSLLLACNLILDVEGKGSTDTKSFFDRLPAKAEGVVPPPVWALSRDSAGLLVRFTPNATMIQARWTVISSRLAMPHMPATGVSGLDLYVKADNGRWQWLGIGQPQETQTNTATLASGLHEGRREFLLYLPLYNGVSSVELGVPEGRVIEKTATRAQGRRKPIVFYYITFRASISSVVTARGPSTDHTQPTLGSHEWPMPSLRCFLKLLNKRRRSNG